MEMVARGLEKHLKLDQREFLMSMLTGVCSEKSQRRAAEALGLVRGIILNLQLLFYANNATNLWEWFFLVKYIAESD